ncbi:DUF1330 domain-containing protein [Nisaea sp.]|uniref:DUF1330 domain-containing protein n=1 Tax=Nisaea sp. TaxID=2024842 RepID=UPI002B265429|nr:DUF1330 domain-containing protein [Nisaea sp.]
MTAFFVAVVAVKDPAKMQDYSKQAAETFKPFGGEMVMRGKAGAVLTGGDANHQATGIASFPSMQDLKAWYASDAYQAIIPLREEAADMTITAYDVPS